MMINEEIEEGELTSDEETSSYNQLKSSSSIIENGEYTEGDATANENPYTKEDEDMIKLKMKALKSLLNKDSNNLKNLDDKKMRKSTKKLKKKNAKIADKPNQMEDNYELQDMDIDPPLTQYQASPVQSIPDYQLFMQDFFNMFQFWCNQNNYNQMNQMNGLMSNQNNYANFNKRPKKKFKKVVNRNLSKKKFFKPNISAPPAKPLVQQESKDDVPLFTFNDVDERFLDTTTTSLDIDYRQLTQLELLNSLEKSDIKELEEPKNDNEEQSDNETEMMNLRKALLDTMTQKRSLKKQQEQEQIDQDISLLKKKLVEHERALLEADQKETNRTKLCSVVRQKTKIDPIIIRIGLSESSDEENEKKNLKKNIGQFLNEAKELAVESTLKRKASDADLSEGDLKKEEEKKDIIKSLRDRINLKSKMLFDLTKQSRDLEKAQLQKSSIVDFSKLKIVMLKDQLTAAEKVLQANEKSLLEIRNQKRSVDLKLNKLQNMRKTQQEMLQKLLNPVQNQKSVQIVSKSPSPPPPPPPPPLPPPPTSVIEQQELQPPPPPSSKPIISKPKTPIIKSILNKMTLGSVVAEAAKSKEGTKISQTDLTRPNLNTSKKTDKELQCLELKNKNLDNLNVCLNENIVVNAKVVSSVCLKEINKKIEDKKIQIENKQKLIDLMEHLSRDYAHTYSHSFDQWSYEFLTNVEPVSLCFDNHILDSSPKASSISIHNVLTSSNFCQFNQCDNNNHANLTSQSNEIHKLDNVEQYESPLKVFRGYRFSSHYAQFSSLEEAYSKTYCNAIDYRRPFCPFDLHGSCKDSNCLYQHSNIMTMDNYQRTEHFLSYCPQLLELSTDTPTQREAIKKLKMYAKQFMNNNLNKMSIRDYFKHLYEHVVENLKLEPSYSTILSRLPILCLNNNKSIGVFDHLELENEPTEETKTCLNNQQLIKLNTSDGTNSFDSNDMSSVLDLVYSANYCRVLDSKLKKLLINNELDLDYLKADNGYLMGEHETIIAWIYYAKVSYSNNCHMEKLISILSHGLESLPKCETLWLLYLKAYLNKKNSFLDYHEVCLLCMDNLITHDLVLFILNTCPIEYLDLIFERYENYLINVKGDDLSVEFEQNSSADCLDRISYYLFELIVFRTYLKLVQDSKAQEFLAKNLSNAAIVEKLEPNDLALIWLCHIHLEAFGYLPNWLSISGLNASFLKSMETKSFWILDKTRLFEKNLARSINFAYKNKIDKNGNVIRRLFDIYMIPWKNGTKYSCSIERLQNLFHEALRSINIRCPTNANTTLEQKQQIRLYSLPLLINLINLEVSNKRYEIASKIVDRLLKSADAKIFKELWIILVYILKCQNMNNLIEQNLSLGLQMFSNDPQLVHLLAQHYASMGHIDKAVNSIEQFIQTVYSCKANDLRFDANNLFNHYLGLEKSARLDQTLAPNMCKLEISILYCYYLELKGAGYFNQLYIEQQFKRLIKNVKINAYRSILWNRYFKFMSCLDTQTDGYSEKVLSTMRKCAIDLATSQNLIPFNRMPRDLDSSSSSLASGFIIDSGQLCPDHLYYSTNESEFCHPQSKANSLTNSFFLSSVVDFLLRAFARSQIEKNSLSKFLLELAPLHTDLIKLHVSIRHKINGLHKSVQFFYDHLSMNHIENEHLWLLCIKLCLDLNDYQQAVLIYHKAEQICSRGKKNLFELKRVKQHLFPSIDEKDV